MKCGIMSAPIVQSLVGEKIVSRFASKTSVSVEKSKAEIEKLLVRYGANQFASATDLIECKSIIRFRAHDRQIQFELPLPNRNDSKFRLTPSTGKTRSDKDIERLWEQACRQSWRALALVVKAKLEAVESGITEFEDEFLAHIVMPNGKTLNRWIRPKIAVAYESGEMPKSVPLLTDGGTDK